MELPDITGLHAIAAAINNLAAQVGRVATALESQPAIVRTAQSMHAPPNVPLIPVAKCDAFLLIAAGPIARTAEPSSLCAYDAVRVQTWDAVIEWSLDVFARMCVDLGKRFEDRYFCVAVYAQHGSELHLAVEVKPADADATLDDVASCGFEACAVEESAAEIWARVVADIKTGRERRARDRLEDQKAQAERVRAYEKDADDEPAQEET